MSELNSQEILQGTPHTHALHTAAACGRVLTYLLAISLENLVGEM